MNIIKLIGRVLILLSLTFATSAMASETLKLEGGFFDKIDGSAKIENVEANQKKISLDFENLKPNAIYTVWLVNEKPEMSMTGLGTGDYSFKSDGNGQATYSALIEPPELNKWQLLKVVLHPDGNPKNMEDIKTALKGELKNVQRTAE